MQRHRPNRARVGGDAPILQRLQALRLGRERRMVAAATAMPAGDKRKGAPSDDAEEEEEMEEGEEQLDEESKGWLGTIKDVLFSSKREKVEAHAVERDESRDVKMLILGFDGTLTMAGYIDPNTTTRVEMTSRNYADFRLKSQQEHVWNLGGVEQIEALKDLFEKLQDFDIELRILSMGTKRAIMYALGLPEVGLLKFFSDDAAGKNGARIWGGDTPPLSDDKAYKGVVIEEWMQELGLHPDEVVVVDDDPVNIDMPDKGKRNPGIAPSLEKGHAILHDYSRRFIDGTMRIVEELCGLVDLDAEGKKGEEGGEEDDEEDDEED